MKKCQPIVRASPAFGMLMEAEPRLVVDAIRKCDKLTTKLLWFLRYTTDSSFLNKLVDEGLIDVLLDFVDQSSMSLETILSERGGDLDSHYDWLIILGNLSMKDSNCLKIAPRIGPLVKNCLPTQTFFQAEKDWRSTQHCIELVNDLCIVDKTIPILLENDELVEFLVQSLFWKLYRPDVVQELRLQERHGPLCDGTLEDMQRMAVRMLAFAFCNVDTQSPEGRIRVKQIGLIPMVDSRFDQENEVAFGTGLLELMKGGEIHAECLLNILFKFVLVNCMDKRTILGMIGVGAGVATSVELAGKFTLATLVAFQGRDEEGHDNRCSIAIKAGVFEMTIDFLVRYGGYDSVIRSTGQLLGLLVSTAREERSAKAIRSRLPQIREAAEDAISKTSGESQLLVRKIVEILQMNRTMNEMSCRQCLKVLDKDSMKLCSRCKRAMYCSKECQTKDWRKEGGHKGACNQLVASDMQAREEGASEADLKKSRDTERQISTAGTKLFVDNLETVFVRAVVKGYQSTLDCVVVIDMLQSPPLLSPVLADDFLSQHTERGIEVDFLKPIFEKNRKIGALTLACEGSAALNDGTTMMIKTVPREGCAKGSWQLYYDQIAERIRPTMRWYSGRPTEAVEEALVELVAKAKLS